MQFLLAETGRGANRPPPAGSGTHQAGSLKILNDLVDGIDSVGQAGTGLQGGDRGGGVGLTGRAGRPGRGDVIRKVAITLENQGKIKK